MSISREKTHELRELGWTTLRQKAKRPAVVPRRSVLQLGEDVTFEATDGESHLVELGGRR